MPSTLAYEDVKKLMHRLVSDHATISSCVNTSVDTYVDTTTTQLVVA